MAKVLITGGSGFIGSQLAIALKEQGYDVVIISRNRPKIREDIAFCQWDGCTLGDWVNELEGARAIVNLAGKSVDCRKTPDNIDLILRSRVDTTRVIGKALNQLHTSPNVWVQMSTAHIYGDPFKECSEDDALGYGLAPFVGQAWEDAFFESIPDSVRPVILRTSFVLGRSGGALPTLARLARLGLGGKVGTGKQGVSWIHQLDLNKLITEAIENEKFSGTYIASAPNPVSNANFMRLLRKELRAPIGLPSPGWLVKLGAALLIDTDPELALYGRYVVSKRLEEANFQFSFPRLEHALANIYG